MKISPPGLDFIKSFEGFVPYVYDDLRAPVNGKYREWKGESVRGTLTIGYGHTNAAKHPLKIERGLQITEAQATEILDVDLDECEKEVNDLVPCELTQGQFDALTSFNFNCGAGNLKRLIAPLKTGNYGACRAKFDLYVYSKGRRLRGLQRRRDGEQALWDAVIPPVPEEKTEHGVDHPADVDRAKEPMKPVTVGTTAAGTGVAVGVGVVEVVKEVATQSPPLAPVPPPPETINQIVTNVGAWKTLGETTKSFGDFAAHQPYLVTAIVLVVLALLLGPWAAKRMGWT